MATIINGSDNFNTSTALKNDGTGRLNTAGITENSSGLVTFSNKPYFYVYDEGGAIAIPNTATVINWTVAENNINNCFDLANNRFTALVAGVYQFTFHQYNHGSNGYNRHYIYINGVTTFYEIQEGIGADHTAEVSGSVYMQVGDYAEAKSQSNNSNSRYRAKAHTYFTGHLVG